MASVEFRNSNDEAIHLFNKRTDFKSLRTAHLPVISIHAPPEPFLQLQLPTSPYFILMIFRILRFIHLFIYTRCTLHLYRFCYCFFCFYFFCSTWSYLYYFCSSCPISCCFFRFYHVYCFHSSFSPDPLYTTSVPATVRSPVVPSACSTLITCTLGSTRSHQFHRFLGLRKIFHMWFKPDFIFETVCVCVCVCVCLYVHACVCAWVCVCMCVCGISHFLG